MLLAIRDSRFVMWNTALAAVVFPPAFYVGSRWGTSGIAWAWIVMYPIITAPYIWRTLSAIDLRTRTYLGAFLPALQTSAIMMVAVVAARLATPQAFPVAVRFTIAVAAGIAAYAAALFFKERDRLRDVLTLIRGDGV
jgi:teichuronic acid exporter